MTKKLSLLFSFMTFVIISSHALVTINSSTFPDENFRNYLLSQSYGEDYVLTDSEIANIVSINVPNKNISNLKGIENFTALIFLNCSNNLLESIDVSKNVALMDLYCSGNNIKSLDLSNNKNLMQLECYNDGLTALNVSGCTKLVTLYCYSNQLGSLDVSGCTALANLYCYQNAIKDTKMDSFIESLPSVSGGTLRIINGEAEGNLMTKSQVTAAKAKGWSPLYYNSDSDMWKEYTNKDFFFRGDANGDGKINLSDVMFIVNCIIGSPDESFDIDNADADQDGEINISDAVFVSSYILKGYFPREKYYTYFGTTMPNVENYKSLSNVATSYSSIEGTLRKTVSVSAGETLYMLCPVSWMKQKNITLENEKGDITKFSNEIDFVTIPEYAIYKMQVLDGPQKITLKLKAYNQILPDLLKNDPNIKTYVKALQLTGLNSMLELVEDLEYRINYNGDYFETISSGIHANEKAYYPEHRYYGFTAFMVKDKILEKYNSMLSNKFNSDGDVSQNILALSELASKYYTTSIPYTSTDYSNTEHPLYKFMAYHLLDRNVHNYNLLTVREDAGIDVSLVNPTDWYTTCLPYSMIKVEHLTVSGEAEGAWLGEGVRGDYYINRNYNKNNKVDGIHVQPMVEAQNINAVNGIYFYVDDILTFDDNTKDKVFNTRIRMDFSTLFPEIMTNNIRMNGPSVTSSNVGKNYCFPQGYLTGVKFNTDDSHLIYCYPKSDSYAMNGDEMRGQGDFTFNLPPVPFTGEWQIRLGYTADEKSGIVQIYLNEYPMGIPLDLSKTLDEIYGLPASDWGNMKYEDLRQDDEKRQEDFKILKNNGYYRGPHSVFNSSNGEKSGKYNTFSEMSNTFRHILSTNNLKVGETYRIRLKKLTTQGNIMLDYLEFVPKSVYGINEGDVEEDL